MKSLDPHASLNEILCLLPELRQVFEGLGFDTERQGKHSLMECCRAQNLELEYVSRTINTFLALSPGALTATVDLMTLRELCDHLETVDHTELLRELGNVNRLFTTLASRRGAEEIRFKMIHREFGLFRQSMIEHLTEETEHILPLIRRMETASSTAPSLRASLKNPLDRMKREHNEADEKLDELQCLASAGSLEDTTSIPFHFLSEALQRLETKLHEQIYKENQILFRRALALRKAS